MVNCKNCAFYIRNDDGGQVGECHRHAPRPYEYEEWFWPVVGEDDFCGESKPKDAMTPDGLTVFFDS